MRKKHNVFLILLLSITIYMLVKDQNIVQIINLVHQSNLYYLLVALGCMFVFWSIESLLIYILLKKITSKGSFWTCVKTTIIGQYYSFITPFASGGQPAQLYVLRKGKVPYSIGTAVVLGKFLLFQITVTLYGLTVFIYRLNHGIDKTSMFFTVVLSALTINVIGLMVITFFSFKPSVVNEIVKRVVKLLKKVHIVKNEDMCIAKCKHFLEEYKVGINQLGDNIYLTISMFLVSVVQITVLFSITYFVYKSLGLSNAEYIDVLSLQSLLYMAIAFIPTPGTVGASEAGFYMILGSVFPQKMIVAALLLWRGISYYFGLVFCGIFTLLNNLLEKNMKYNR